MVAEIMSFIGYKKDFEVHKSFNLVKFIRVLDKENFNPFVLHIEQITKYKYKLSFQRIKTPIFVTPVRKGSVADEILLSECTLEFLKSLRKIRFVASITNGTLIVMGFLILLFMIPPVIMHTALAWIPILVFILLHLLRYYWDVKRYRRIGELAMNQSNQ